MKLQARIAGAAIGLQVDVGLGDAVVPPPAMLELPPILDFTAPQVRAYSRYTVAAEKIQATVELGLANTRLKDFFDLFVLASRFDFAGPVLTGALQATFTRRGAVIPAEPPIALSERFSQAPDKLSQWNAFLRRARVRIPTPPLPELVTLVAQLALEPLEAARTSRALPKRWGPGGPWTAVR